MLETYLNALETGYYEVTFAFEGLADENVWNRPAPGLLSVGELAAHIAFGEATHFTAEGNGEGRPDLTTCKVQIVLIDPRFAYYPHTLELAPSDEHLAMTAEQVCQELVRVHKESVEYLKALNPDLNSVAPGWPEWHTYLEFVKYMIFHVAYHTGQMYSVRHLLGDTTPDN